MHANKTTKMDEHRSIEIISQMIAQTTADIDRHSGKYFLLWGYTTVIVTLCEYFAYSSGADVSLCSWFWWLIPLIGGIGTLWLNKTTWNDESPRPKSHIDRSISAVWSVLGFSYGMVFIAALTYQTSILFLTAIIMSMGTVISGKICQHGVLTICGKVSMVLSLLFPARHLLFDEYSAGLRDSGIEQFEYLLYGEMIIFAVIFIVMMVVPGHILYNRAKRYNNA